MTSSLLESNSFYKENIMRTEASTREGALKVSHNSHNSLNHVNISYHALIYYQDLFWPLFATVLPINGALGKK